MKLYLRTTPDDRLRARARALVSARFVGAVCLFSGLLAPFTHAGNLTAWRDQAQGTSGNVTASTNGGTGWTLNGSAGVAYNFGALDSLDGKPVNGSTVEFIFNLTDAGSSTAIATVGGQSSSGQDNVFKLEQWNDTGKIGITLPGSADHKFDTDSAFGQEVHVVFRRNNDSGTMDLFINGVFVEKHTDKTNWRLDGGSGYIGSSSNGSTDAASGQIFGVASYDVALSNLEVAALYGAYAGPLADPHAVVTPAALDFGDYTPGSGTQDLSVTIANFGVSANLSVTSIQVTGPDAGFFSVGSFPASLAPQGSADVTVTFDPSTAVGPLFASLEIETDGANQTSFAVPIKAFAFDTLPDKAAILVVVPHPDDEGLFYGGTMTYYSKIRNLPTVLIAMTSGDSGINPPDPADRFLREDEFRNAARVYGLKYEPIFARFDDGGSSIDTVDTWTQFPNTGDDAADYLSPFVGNPVEYTARWIRILRPEVLLTSDAGGDYGHQDHRHTSAAVVAAFDMAADASVTILDDGGNPLPAWTVTKFYVHDADFDDASHLGHLFHTRWEQAYDELGGSTPRVITGLGLEEHVSQAVPRQSRSYYGDPWWGSQYEPSELWTMLESSVGLDTFNTGELSYDSSFDAFPDIHHGDFLENIDLTLFSSYLADADGNGVIDEADLQIVLGNQGQNVAPGSVASGDANGDGYVNQSDLDLVHSANPDTDADELPDVWELEHFASLAAADPTADPDGDGVTTLDEFVAGLDPDLADQIDFWINGALQSINFSVPAASGVGYSGLTRYYQLLFSHDLVDWSTVVVDGVADGSPQTEPIPEGQSKGFYKLDLRVE